MNIIKRLGFPVQIVSKIFLIGLGYTLYKFNFFKGNNDFYKNSKKGFINLPVNIVYSFGIVIL